MISLPADEWNLKPVTCKVWRPQNLTALQEQLCVKTLWELQHDWVHAWWMIAPDPVGQQSSASSTPRPQSLTVVHLCSTAHTNHKTLKVTLHWLMAWMQMLLVGGNSCKMPSAYGSWVRFVGVGCVWSKAYLEKNYLNYLRMWHDDEMTTINNSQGGEEQEEARNCREVLTVRVSTVLAGFSPTPWRPFCLQPGTGLPGHSPSPWPALIHGPRPALRSWEPQSTHTVALSSPQHPCTQTKCEMSFAAQNLSCEAWDQSLELRATQQPYYCTFITFTSFCTQTEFDTNKVWEELCCATSEDWGTRQISAPKQTMIRALLCKISALGWIVRPTLVPLHIWGIDWESPTVLCYQTWQLHDSAAPCCIHHVPCIAPKPQNIVMDAEHK